MNNDKKYIVADRCFCIKGEKLTEATNDLCGFEQFETDESHIQDFDIIYSDKGALPDIRKKEYSFTAEGVDSLFSSHDSGYIFQMKHDDGTNLDLWSYTGKKIIYIKGCLSPQLLRFALWIAYGIMNVNRKRIPIHGSCIVNNDRAFLFLGESGTGKSTHTRLWRKYIPGSFLLNDDSPIIAAENRNVYIYGSPWSGKTPCYRQERYPLCGCVRLSQAPENKIGRLSILQSYAALHPSCPPEFAYDEYLYNGISESLDTILRNVAVYHLECLPDADAARLSYNTLTGNTNE